MRRHALAIAILALTTACGSPASPTTPAAQNTPVATGQPTSVTTPPATSTESTPAAATATPAVSAPAAALVNQQPILLEDFETQVNVAKSYLSQEQSFDPNTQEGKASIATVRRQVLEWLIDQKLIEQAATRVGLVVSEADVDAEVTELIGTDEAKFDEWLQANQLTRDTFKAQLRRELLGTALQQHIIGSLPTQVEQVHARHILVSDEGVALQLLVRLRSGESFASLAKEYSEDQSTLDNGGDLGFFPRGVMLPELEAVAFSLEPGRLSGVVSTEFGYHIVEVVEKDPAREIPEEMLPTWREKMFLAWLTQERTNAQIDYLIPLD